MTRTPAQLARMKALDYQQLSGEECPHCGLREPHRAVIDCTRSLAAVVTMMADNVAPSRGRASIEALRECIAELDCKICNKGRTQD